MLRKLKVLPFIILSVSIFGFTIKSNEGFTAKSNKFCGTQVVVRNNSNSVINRIEIFTFNTVAAGGYGDYSNLSIPPGGSFQAPPNNPSNYTIIVDFVSPVSGSWRVVYAKSPWTERSIACGRTANSTRVQGSAYLTDGCSFYYFDVSTTYYC